MSKEKKQRPDSHENNQDTGSNSNNNAVTQSATEEDLQQKLQEETERRLRIMADFDNYKKRVEQEKAMFGAIANLGLIQQILEINDDLQLALDDSELDLERAKSSIQNAQDKIKAAAASAGVEAVEVKVGDEFDKERMEAIQAIPDEKNKNKVIAVISSAYKYANREGVIKPAKVIVGK